MEQEQSGLMVVAWIALIIAGVAFFDSARECGKIEHRLDLLEKKVAVGSTAAQAGQK